MGTWTGFYTSNGNDMKNNRKIKRMFEVMNFCLLVTIA